MSWSISRGGKPADVRRAIVQDAAAAAAHVGQHSADEASVLHAAVSAALAAVGACHPEATVSVSMYGSESAHYPGGLGDDPLRAQSVSISISAQLPPLG